MRLAASFLCLGREHNPHCPGKKTHPEEVSEWRSLKDKGKSDTQSGKERAMTTRPHSLTEQPSINKQVMFSKGIKDPDTCYEEPTVTRWRVGGYAIQGGQGGSLKRGHSR